MSAGQTLPSRTFASLPELLALLVPCLTSRDLLQCIQVCRFWNQVFIPHLWCSIDDSTLAWKRFIDDHRRIKGDQDGNNDSRDGSDDDDGLIRHVFHKYGRFIQNLDLQNRCMINAATNSSDNNSSSSHLCSLRFAVSPAENRSTTLMTCSDSNALVTSAWRLALHHQTTLTTLRMDQSISSPTLFTSTLEPSTVPITTLMYDVLSELSCLLELEINDASADFNKILEVAPQLEVLRAPGWLQLTSPDGRLLHRKFTAAHLKEIELFHETDSRAVLSLLRYLSNLESLLLTGGFNQESFQNDYGAAIEAKAAMNNAPNMSLRRLYLRSRGSMDYRILAAILPWVPELREFSCESLHLRMSEILVKNCKHLEVVRELDSFGGDYDPRALPRGVDVVLPLLTGCPTLRVLDTAAHSIQGDIFMNCELACLGLETFRCQIIGMYWLDEANSQVLNRLLSGNSEGDGDANGSGTGATTSIEEQGLLDEVCRNQERYRRVYKQLSRMTQLRVLELGQEWRTVSRLYDTRIDGEDEYDDIYDEPDNGYYAWYPPPIDGTLDLTLVSGLDQLSTLKELEVFGFEGVDHQMEKVELDWMAVQWPKLKVMRGIHIDIFPKVEPDTKRRELREYMQMLRPDVVHETLFKH